MVDAIVPKNEDSLELISNKKIFQHNELITSVAKMDKVPLKIFEMAVAHLNTKEVPEDRTVYLKKELLYSFMNYTSENKHTMLKKTLLKLHEQAIFHMRNKIGTDQYEMKIISPIEETQWTNYDEYVSIQFTSKIMPYLIDMKEHYTQYFLSDLARLNSKYSIIIFKWLTMNVNQYYYYKDTKSRSKKQLHEYQNPKIKVEELKRMTDTVSEYGRFDNFEKRVLEIAKKEINEYTNLNVTYDKVKAGRKIDTIEFHIEKKPEIKNEFYKEEEQDEKYLEDKLARETRQKESFVKAIQEPYTMWLIENNLIEVSDMQDVKLMAELYDTVYNKYDDIKDRFGINEVEKHIIHVRNNQEGYSKPNTASYLRISADNRIKRLEGERAKGKI